jgi:hypothetical protein
MHKDMTVVSTKEFNAHQDMYLDMALDEDIFVKRGDLTYSVSIADNGYSSEYDEVLEPDEDFRRAITMDEFLIGVKEDLREIFRKGKR